MRGSTETSKRNLVLNAARICEPLLRNNACIAALTGTPRFVQPVFTQGRGFVVVAYMVCDIGRFADAFWLTAPETPPLRQRGFFLVN